MDNVPRSPQYLFVLPTQPGLPLGHIPWLELPEQFANCLLVCSRGVFAVLLLNLRNDLADDRLKNRVIFERIDCARDF
jgi:hypothetical protein